MVTAAEIRDEASLRTWLEGRPRQDAVAIAARAALRVAPLYWAWVADPRQTVGLSELSASRLVLSSAVAAVRPTAEIELTVSARTAATTAGNAADVPEASRAAAAAVLAYTAAAGARHSSRNHAAHAATAAARASDAASDAAADAAAVWQAVAKDADEIEAGRDPFARPLWPDGTPDWVPMVHRDWRARGGAWVFWADWYEGYLTGKPLDIDLLQKVAEIEPEDWDKGDDHVNGIIAGIYDTWQSRLPSALAQAAVFDFTFDGLHRWMKATGFEDDLRHLRDPAAVQAFLDDLSEVEAGLKDFTDYAAEARGRTNASAVLQVGAEKLLSEINHTRDIRHIRARRLVTLGRQLEAFLSEEDKCSEIGTTLQRVLEDAVATFRDLCRRHFAPSLVVLQALDGLDLDGTPPDLVIAKLDAAILRIAAADGHSLVPLRPEDLGLLRQMVEDLRLVSASVGEARTEQFAEVQRKRLARGAGEFASTIGRYVEKASAKAESAGKRFDGAVKWYHRWEKLGDFMEWLEKFFPGGPPP